LVPGAGAVAPPVGAPGSGVALGATLAAATPWGAFAARPSGFDPGLTVGRGGGAVESRSDEPGPGDGVGELVPEVAAPGTGCRSPAGDRSGSGPADDRRFDDRMQPTDMATPTSPVMARRTLVVRRSCGIGRS
jgi:hypothetical protein